MRKTALVLGAGGFIGSHLVERLKTEGMVVHAADLKHPDFAASPADRFVLGDLRDPHVVRDVLDRRFDEVYQLAADMGGAGYIFTGEHDAQIMHNSATINLNVLDACHRIGVGRLFYSSSACIYPAYNQQDPDNPTCSEASAYPADPDSEYGWEKLFSERLYMAYRRNFAIDCHIARYHNIFGPMGTWRGGKEKAPAALCRKVAEAEDGGTIEVWGDGLQTRSFLFIDECLEGTLRLMRSGVSGPLNIGSDEMVSINGLARLIIDISGKSLSLRNIPGPVGVRGRTSDNTLLRASLDWAPDARLAVGLAKTYAWISRQTAALQAAAGSTTATTTIAMQDHVQRMPHPAMR
ncbi:NAD-dependent epimerase/dehydratase family protein [Paracoccus sp. ME4]|uniref:NAD-dependent epimerase/dehydratase family protein n=1 Tax=Paracoccus sp. ME4 TaxID=3138066 RepID=UPI00398AFA0F